MKKIIFIFFLIIILLSIFNCSTPGSGSGGRDGDDGGDSDNQIKLSGLLDPSFDVGTGPDKAIHSIAIQPDGKIIIAGDFTSYNGVLRDHIARINVDGSLDEFFYTTYTGMDGFINSVVIQPDGKILIAGGFTSYRGYTRNNIARINYNGYLDTSFDPGTGTDNQVRSVSIQPDGKILIAGDFDNYNGTHSKCVVRVEADGSLDTSFNNGGTGANNQVSSVSIQPDGKIIIAGNFTSYNGISRNRIARINVDGSLDTSFDPGNGASSFISSLVLQSDGKILINGYFEYYNSIYRKYFTRANTDGSLDTSFDPGAGVNFFINSLVLQSDGKIVIGGNFTSYNGISRNRIARINVDGSLDTSFDPGSGVNNSIYSIAIQLDGKIIIAGNFTSYNGTLINRFARISRD